MTFHRAEPQPAASSERRTFLTHGSSMLPSMPPGSEVSVVCVDPRSIRCGDVVGYPGRGGTMILHRVVEIRRDDGETTIVVRGDSQSQAEELPARAIAYRAVRVRIGPVSYGTDGLAGGIVRELAMQRGLPWRVATRAARLALGLIARATPGRHRDSPDADHRDPAKGT